MQKTIFVALNALALFSCVSISRADEVLRMRPGIAVMVRVSGAEKGDMKAIVGNPDVADVTFGPNNVFWFVGKKQRTTNIIVLNGTTGAEAYNATIEVGPDQPPPPDRKKIITMYVLPKNAQDHVITRQFYCDPGCTYLSPTLGGDISASSTTVRHQNAEGVETGRSIYESNSTSPSAPVPVSVAPAGPPQ